MALYSLIPRVPEPLEHNSERLRRHCDEVATRLNELTRKGHLVPTAAGSWGLAGLFFSGHGNPDPSLGWIGDHYFDLDGGVLWKYL